MAVLQNILYKVRNIALHGSTSVEVEGLYMDSRKVKQRAVFIAVKGTQVDGHQFIESAIEMGAAAVICEDMPDWLYPEVTYVKVEDAAVACGVMASNYYKDPSFQLTLVGVTGTNGKTTIATLLFQLFRSLGYRCGLLSTVQNQIDDQVISSTHTTPDAIHLNALLADMVAAGCEYVFMEVSSHAIHQKRVVGLQFSGGVFSNITHDHLDYHKTFEAYLKVKKSFFDDLPKSAFALTNADDKRGAVMLQNTKAHTASYGIKMMADYKGKILENNLTGLSMNVDGEEVHFRMIGTFNAYNILAVYGAASLLHKGKKEVLLKLSALTGAEGRLDFVVSPKIHLMGIVDYAHTPDALLNVLVAINQLRKSEEQVITVVGCGGDRDKTKRPEMAQVAVQYSDKVILTSDNPRSEDPEVIIKEMESGVPVHQRHKLLLIADRRAAIKAACALGKSQDIVLVAGKGHEKYQEIKGVKKPFDDKIILREMFKELDK